MKKEAFKEFARSHPELINYLKNNSNMNWQKLYEIYDIYGEDEKVWEPYLSNNNTSIKDILNGVDTKKVQEHIGTAQKALNLIQELTTKGGETLDTIKGPILPRPITKFFGD